MRDDVFATRKAWDLIGSHGLLRLPGGRAVYHDVMYTMATARGNRVRLARLEARPYGLRQVNHWVDPDQMVELLHKPGCIAAKAADAAWRERWPDACTACWGAGGHASGGAYPDPPSWDECVCLAQARCPRCAQPVPETDGSGVTRCPACGWDDDIEREWLDDRWTAVWDCMCDEGLAW